VGILTLVLILGSTTLLTPLCAPCLGLLMGFVAGFAAGAYDKPGNAREAVHKGVTAGALAGALGFIGDMVGSVNNGAVVTPQDLASIYQFLNLSNPQYDQATIWMLQLASGFCIGLFDIGLMAIFGMVGGASWFQLKGKNQNGAAVHLRIQSHRPSN
ncbi:MAG: hypothetical protein ACM3H7_04875, partial [Acidobacteriaceae bacterium]